MAISLTARQVLYPTRTIATVARIYRLRERTYQPRFHQHTRKRIRSQHLTPFVCLCSQNPSPQDEIFEDISVQQLSTILTDPQSAENIQFVDVREPWEVELASLPYFKTHPLKTVLDGDAVDDLEREKTTIVLCHHGLRSRTASAYFKVVGFSQVFNVKGGIDAYASLVDPSVGKY